MIIDPIRGSIWKSHVNFFLGTMLLASVGLWASVVMVHAAWGINPVTNAFAAVVKQETQLPQ